MRTHKDGSSSLATATTILDSEGLKLIRALLSSSGDGARVAERAALVHLLDTAGESGIVNNINVA